MKGLTDNRLLLGVIIFLGTFAFIQTLWSTEYITNTVNVNYTVYWNGTAYTNLTGSTVQGAIPTPPICEAGYIVIDGVLGCVAGYVAYYWALLTFNTDIAWLNILILLPLLAVVGFVVVKLLIELGKIVADLIPFT